MVLGDLFNDGKLEDINLFFHLTSCILHPLELAEFMLRCLFTPEVEWSEDNSIVYT
jgi:hypothetical protein